MHVNTVRTRGRSLGAGTLQSPAVLPLCACAALLLAGFVAQAADGLAISEDAATGRYTVTEGAKPVLTYNFATVPVPAGVTGKYAVARGDYVHPLYGPNGELLTQDYAPDHPHHRGLYWAWPEVTWKGTAYALTRDEPLTMRFRVVVCEGDTGEATLARLWSEYAEAAR